MVQLLGIKVSSSVIEENRSYDIMLPPEADYDDNHYTADYDLFIWSWYGEPGPERAAADHPVRPDRHRRPTACGAIPSTTSCTRDQNVAAGRQARKAIIDQMQN